MIANIMLVCNRAKRQDEAIRLYEKYFQPFFGSCERERERHTHRERERVCVYVCERVHFTFVSICFVVRFSHPHSQALSFPPI